RSGANERGHREDLEHLGQLEGGLAALVPRFEHSAGEQISIHSAGLARDWEDVVPPDLAPDWRRQSAAGESRDLYRRGDDHTLPFEAARARRHVLVAAQRRVAAAHEQPRSLWASTHQAVRDIQLDTSVLARLEQPLRQPRAVVGVVLDPAHVLPPYAEVD